LADLGRKISADYIAQGHVGRFSGELTIKVELYNVGSSNLIGSFTGDSKDLKGLLSVLEAKAPKLFEDMISTTKEKEKPAPPPPAPESAWDLVGRASDLEDAVDVELGYKLPARVDSQVNTEEYRPSNNSFWIALALDVAGAAFVGYGIYKNSEVLNKHEEYGDLRSGFGNSWEKVEDAKTSRNVSYILGGVLLASGIGVHIWF